MAQHGKHEFCHIHPTAKVADSAQLGVNVIVMENAWIGENSSIGNNVVIYPGTRIGDEVTVFDNAVLGRQPKTAGNLTRPFAADIGPLVIGNGCVIGACAIIYAGTTLGAKVLVSDLVSIREQCVVEDLVVLGRGVILNYEVRIGKRTKIMDQTHITGKCCIGDDCFISVLVATTNENTMGLGDHQPTEGPVIGDRARIGAGTTVLPGKTIGRDAIVAAASLVSTNIPDRTLAGGSPARVIRDNPYLKGKIPE
jgi:acetyltransferase-like isoleucine patch superfamily enzyme